MFLLAPIIDKEVPQNEKKFYITVPWKLFLLLCMVREKVYNDYGQGFYCTESLELAKEWSCAEREDGYVNQYEMDETGLLILNLMEKHYSVLHWLAILMKYRKIHRTAVRKALYTFTERE